MTPATMEDSGGKFENNASDETTTDHKMPKQERQDVRDGVVSDQEEFKADGAETRNRNTSGHKLFTEYVSDKYDITAEPNVRSEHTSDDTDDDNIKCAEHAVEDGTMYCRECDTLLCRICIAGGSHEQHSIQTIEDVISTKQKELSDVANESVEKIHSSSSTITSIQSVIKNYSRDVSKCVSDVKNRNVHIKNMLDEITDDVIANLQSVEELHISKKKMELLELEKDVSTLKYIANGCQERQTQRKPELMRFVTCARKTLGQIRPTYVPISPKQPVLSVRELSFNNQKELFGDINLLGHNIPHNTKRQLPVTTPVHGVKVISSFTAKEIDRVVAVSDKQALVGSWGKHGLKRIASDGREVSDISVEFAIDDIAVNKSGEIYITGFGGVVQKLTTDGLLVDVYICENEWCASGITVTDAGDIIFGESLDDMGTVIKIFPNGKLMQTIRYGPDGKTALFGYICSVGHNTNGDIIVVEEEWITVVDKDGYKRFTYKGDSGDLSKPFKPCYTVTDKHGHILISECNNSVVHMLGLKGNFIKHIVTPKDGLLEPKGLTIDKGHLWICSSGNNTMMVVRYK